MVLLLLVLEGTFEEVRGVARAPKRWVGNTQRKLKRLLEVSFLNGLNVLCLGDFAEIESKRSIIVNRDYWGLNMLLVSSCAFACLSWLINSSSSLYRIFIDKIHREDCLFETSICL
jgi:hypothetical protein